MSEVSLMQVAIGGSALVAGLVIGLLIGRIGRGGREEADWRMRMAARDRELADTVDRLADAEVELQSLRDRVVLLPTHDPETDARLAELTEELAQADEELTRLRSLGVDQSLAGSTDLARRLEALEVELSTLASMRCPDPAAHRKAAAHPSAAITVGAPIDDDLTRITGVGPGLAEILRQMGYRTFGDIARLTDRDLEEIAKLAGGIAGPSAREGWAESARRLADHNAA